MESSSPPSSGFTPFPAASNKAVSHRPKTVPNYPLFSLLRMWIGKAFKIAIAGDSQYVVNGILAWILRLLDIKSMYPTFIES